MRISDWSSDVCSSDLTDLSPSGSNPSYLGEYHAPAGACRASQATEGRSSCLASSSIASARWPRPCRRMIAAFACSKGGPVTSVIKGTSGENGNRQPTQPDLMSPPQKGRDDDQRPGARH